MSNQAEYSDFIFFFIEYLFHHKDFFFDYLAKILLGQPLFVTISLSKTTTYRIFVKSNWNFAILQLR